ncbi:PAAR domain-containing protein [Hafnia alvei]|uniref:PAAR domain-containing protein n=1 Tax=Hafnia alvei TaxID=569 RepID=UPI00345CD4DD
MTTNKLPQMYTNELTPEILSNLDVSPFSDETLSTLSDDSMAIIQEQEAYIRAHPPIGIFRFAAEGSQTRGGGTVKIASSGVLINLKNGSSVQLAKVGDSVIYPDGTTTLISSGAGKEHRFGQVQAALVGSGLDNGDEIINTPQDSLLIIKRLGEAMPDDFLVELR